MGAAALWFQTGHRWGIAFAATVFAIVGFLVGPSFTLRGGEAVDIAYHATVLPLLLITLVVLLRMRATPSPGRHGRAMRIGLQITDYTWEGGARRLGPGLARIARAADEAGFDSIGVGDHLWQVAP